MQFIIWRDRPLEIDHPEGQASCKWSYGENGFLQMIIRRDWPLANDLPGSRFNLAALSRTICSCSNTKGWGRLKTEKNSCFSKKELKAWYKGFKRDCPNAQLTKEKVVYYPNWKSSVLLCFCVLIPHLLFCIRSKGSIWTIFRCTLFTHWS